MRTLLLALMIALLPIRGWLGDAMAVEMVRHSLPAASLVAQEASPASAAVDAHCHEAMEAADDSGGMDTMAHHHDDGSSSNDHGTDHQGCGTCTACQVCHTVALGGMPLVDIAHSAPQAPPAAHAARFASAEPVLGLKPPIS
ncbi:uncharacterized protein involved in copper resistance [Variovorax boronicumulans]|uniref:hypothetical protein n=1 Tax=Variovorax boronicumulans TaxID=436515 RepID=UPI002786ADC0|nr:hypothetical protein [Variovorax boronicumulans]MDQ0037729.1 uncharacterized protein involved in copper resistance [Variovorax boronicumulans]